MSTLPLFKRQQGEKVLKLISRMMVVFGFLLGSLVALNVSATPMYITFEGEVDYSLGATPEYAGQHMVAEFMYDMDIDGYFVLADGTVVPGTDTATFTYFYAEAISTTLDSIPFIAAGKYGGQTDNRYAGTGTSSGEPRTLFHAQDSFHVFADALLTDLTVGYTTPSNFWAQFVTDTENIQIRGYEVTHHSGTPQASVPIPATLALLTIGFAGLGWARHKRATVSK